MLTHPLHTNDHDSVDNAVPTQAASTIPRSVEQHSALRLCMDFADPELTVLTVCGEVDTMTAQRLGGLLWPRLQTKLRALALEVQQLTFLGVDGLELLDSACTKAQNQGIALGLVGATRPVDRALAAAGLDTRLPCFSTLAEARATLGKPTATASRPAVESTAPAA